ncbi:alpha/beta hydrolase [Exilibacterium tricleocarpae]|uniref:Alpha/beta hydrolase n=1 Tax=Exilibacterium tricleocarpae TaxID=2591008 RepID=A0A545U3H7_9GAMM|nr:alpha/beta hydrolase [Exilibacterium tricleocarpae]TQV84029.1 alpha/beta hydrolase [Exilibacterium tricleocarpae]
MLIRIGHIITRGLALIDRFLAKLIPCLAALAAAGCQAPMLPDFESLAPADAVGYRAGKPFRHLVVERLQPAAAAARQPATGGGWLHVYIEGDGIPWINHRHINDDPTPRYPLALHLMSLDSGRAIYLGRPCYFGTDDPHCETTYWTDGRYAEPVIDSMMSVLGDYCENHRLVLIGYSGGGVIALLGARQLPCADLVVTVASNLDIEGWTAFHGYLPLRTSVNPAAVEPPAGVRQLHLVGGRDQNVPLAATRRFFQHTATTPAIYPRYDHRCCWVEEWPRILQQIEAVKASMREG